MFANAFGGRCYFRYDQDLFLINANDASRHQTTLCLNLHFEGDLFLSFMCPNSFYFENVVVHYEFPKSKFDKQGCRYKSRIE